jgi:predicted RNA-binding Zn-ribbon protein involved in translation (DUF1610 family)
MSGEMGTIIIAAAAVIYVFYKFTATKSEYVCPNCDKKFTPKITQRLFTVHFGSSYTLKCPNCGKIALMKYAKSQNEDK